MKSSIEDLMKEKAKMNADPMSMEHHDLYDKELLSIANAIVCLYEEKTRHTDEERRAYEWAIREIGWEHR